MDPEAVDKNLRKEPRLAEWLPELGRRFAALEPFDHASAEAALRAYADELGVKAGVLINAARTAVTGRSVGPSLFDDPRLPGARPGGAPPARRPTRLTQRFGG